MLLNKHNLNITQFASKEETRYALKGILVTEHETVATNGHILVRVTTPTTDEKNFPDVPGFEQHAEFKPFILPSDAAKEIAKATPKHKSIPVLNHARVSSNGAVQVATTDLDNPRVFNPKPLVGQFPNWQAILPKGEPEVSVTISADYLTELAKAAGKMADDRSKAIKLRIYNCGSFKQVSIEVTCSDTGQTFQSVLMPMRD
jgi:DNA polymerase III sliding clamp (beta) subunit (PCNA family)